MEHGAEHPRDGRAAVPRHEDDDDALAAPVHPHEDVRAGAGRPRQVPRPWAQRARQLLHGLRGGGETSNKKILKHIKQDFLKNFFFSEV